MVHLIRRTTSDSNPNDTGALTFSVIIISYNVKYFLEQCLCSVQAAITTYAAHHGTEDIEVIVVDNSSTDDTINYSRPRFPSVQFIANSENAGFARANNYALTYAKGDYVLFLNPDTIIPEDLFVTCLAFVLDNPDAGALGVKMIDGQGNYLKESKRGFPTPWVALCRLTGLSALFPRSRYFARYYLGHLQENETHAVDALAGACMLCRKPVLEKTNGFDERFFMYAEDIDLSLRITQAGYQNYYLGQTRIIHFKGESTQKDFRYVRQFYRAMSQFVDKHYLRTGPLLKMAIWARGFVAAIAHTLRGTQSPQQNPELTYGVNGDEASSAEVLTGAPFRFVNPDNADCIIYCQGREFAFSAIIGKLEQTKKATLIHGSGSGSAVGSFSKDTIGCSVALEHNDGFSALFNAHKSDNV